LNYWTFRYPLLFESMGLFHPTLNFSRMPTPRVPLGSIDGNIRRRQPVTLFSRGYVEKGASNGESATSLDRELGMPESTVRRTLELSPLARRQEAVTQPRFGRPPIACPSCRQTSSTPCTTRTDPHLRSSEDQTHRCVVSQHDHAHTR
jgi:hypothetical protein